MKYLFEIITSRTVSARRDLSLLTLLFSIAFFQFLGRLPLMEPDEGRYSEIPREMIERGDFVTPMLNYVKYFEKPPLHYWLNIISMKLFGETEFAGRFPGTLCGLLTVLFIYYLGRKLFGRREGFLAALILGSTTGFLIQSRINLTDMTLTCCMTVAIGSFLLASRHDEPHKLRHYYLFYLCSALAVLAKGLIGFVLPGGVLFLYMLFCRRWSLLRTMALPSGLLLFFAVAAPWFVVVSLRNPEFAHFFFIHEHFQRFLSDVHGRYQPVWFFIPILLLTMLPWSFFVPTAVARAWRERRGEYGERVLYLLIWAGFIFLFFSKSHSKLIPYILPVFAPLSLLVGRLFSRCLDGETIPRKSGMVAAVILVMIGCGFVAYPSVSLPLFGAVPFATPLGGMLLGSLFLLEGVMAFVFVRDNRGGALLLTFVAGGVLLSVTAPHVVLPLVSEKNACSRELCRMVKATAGPDTAVVSVGYEQGLPFYAGRRVILAGNMGELEFGAQRGDQSSWFMEEGRLPALWDSERPVVALITPDSLVKLKTAALTPVRVIGEDHRKLLISNR